MEQELTNPLVFKVKRARAHSRDRRTSFDTPRRQSVRIRESQLECEDLQLSLLSTSQILQWQKSDVIQQSVQSSPQKTKIQKKIQAQKNGWFGAQQKQKKKDYLNQMFLHLTPKVQKFLYILNFILNVAIRVMFINLLVFLGIIDKWIYLKAFLSLYLIAIMMYMTIMVKMLFTREDTESVYFQKIFNQRQWSDIQSQRLMGSHFDFWKIISKITVFFNPFTKFQKNTKISFLKQQIFKRIELILVIIPFSCVFFIRPYDFIREDQPNFNLYITWAICIEALKTTSNYLIVYLCS